MKLPGWMKATQGRNVAGRWEVIVSVRRWHPGYWLFALRSVKEIGFSLRIRRKRG